MINLEQAILLVKSKYPDLRIICCDDYGDSYSFWMMDRKWDGKKETCPCGSNTYLVDKESGHISVPSFDEFFDYSLERGKPKSIDVSEYLSKEDLDFSERVMRRIKEEERKLEESE